MSSIEVFALGAGVFILVFALLSRRDPFLRGDLASVGHLS
jgi:hypothetical protein